jgi:hypothetical protein
MHFIPQSMTGETDMRNAGSMPLRFWQETCTLRSSQACIIRQLMKWSPAMHRWFGAE